MSDHNGYEPDHHRGQLAPIRPGAEPPAVADRPVCGYCGKRLQPVMYQEWTPDHSEGQRYWSGKYHCYGEFCTLRCCKHFANAAYQAGYRIKGRS